MSRIFGWVLLTVAFSATSLHGAEQAAAAAAPASADAAASAARAFCENTLHGALWQRTELYFGTSRADGPAVTDEEFTAFLAEEVTPRFPDGLTLVDADGQYRGSSGVIVRERSKLLILFYPWSRLSNARIEKIRDAYKNAFHQEAVLRADSTSCVSF